MSSIAPGFLVVDKPAGITSHDVVAAVRAVTGIKKVGHTGTLDPFATGVLPLALGGATRLIEFLDESIKVYDATIRLGIATNTGDPTGEVVREQPVPPVTEADVRAVLSSFIGERMQEPPAYSAVKVEGKPLYHYARRGEVKRAAPRKVIIHDMEFVRLDGDILQVVITCSRGTYARVLADELAVALGTAGHLAGLMRPRSGPFYLDDAIDMPTLAAHVSGSTDTGWKDVLMARGRNVKRIPWLPRSEVQGSLRKWVRAPIEVLTHLPLADVLGADARRIRNGATPPAPPPNTEVGGRYLVVNGREVVAVAERTPRGPRTVKVLHA